MSAFQTLPGAIIANLAPPTAEQLAFRDEQLKNEAALNLVLQDVSLAERYQTEKRFQVEMEFADNIYRAFVKPRTWPGTDAQRANLGMPLVLETIDISLLPTIYMGFFSDPQPFLLEPEGKTDPKAARAISNVLCWAIKEADFAEEIRKTIKSCLQYGTGVCQTGWKTKKVRVTNYSRAGAPAIAGEDMGQITVPTTESDSIKRIVTEHDVDVPTLEYVDLRNLLVDGGCREQDIRKARFVIKQLYVTANDLDDLRDQEGYENIPTREKLKEILAAKMEPAINSHMTGQPYFQAELQAAQKTQETSVDPLLQPLELLEYWTDDRVITVLQRTLVIRNDFHDEGKHPFKSCSFIDVLNSFYGYGVSKLLGGEQLFQQGVVNSYIDGLALSLNPSFQRVNGVGAQGQDIIVSPGKVTNTQGELKPLSMPSNSAEAISAIQGSEQRAVRRVGAQGADNMPTQALRTAEGVQSFTSGVANRMQYFIDCFSRLVYVPVLESFIQSCKDNLKPSQINTILSDTDGKVYEGDVLDLYNGSYTLDVLSSTKLAARRAMANLIPMFVQLFSSEGVQDSLQVQGKKVDYVELVEQSFDLIGWNGENIIVDMTQDDLNRANPEQQKAQAAQAQQQQKQQDTLEQIEATGEMRAGVQTVKHILDSSAAKDKVSLGL